MQGSLFKIKKTEINYVHQIYGLFNDNENMSNLFMESHNCFKSWAKKNQYQYILWGEKECNELIDIEYPEYFEMYKLGTIDSADPEVFSVKPDNVLDLYPTPNSITPVYSQYWKVPTELAADTDVSSIPSRFQRIIIARAKIYYGENEDAPEVLTGSLAEFEDLLDKLEADQLPGQKNRRMLKTQDLANFTVVPE